MLNNTHIYAEGAGYMEHLDKIIELRKQIFQLHYNHYMNVTLFSAKWWIMVVITILIIIIWWKLVDKKRFLEISLTGFVTGILVMIADDCGLELVLFAYPTQIFELVKHVNEIELVLMTVTYMLLYQYFGEWKNYIIALIVLSAIGAFVGVPLAVRFGIYRLIKWRYLYSFLVFIGLGVIIKFIVSKIMNIQKRSAKHS
jgi:hypothetical protein